MSEKVNENPNEKVPVNMKFEKGLLDLIDQFQKETFASTRTDAIKDLCKFALHAKGYLDKI